MNGRPEDFSPVSRISSSWSCFFGLPLRDRAYENSLLSFFQKQFQSDLNKYPHFIYKET